MRNHFILKRMADDSLFLIDIDKVLREKAPKYYKYIPGFVVSYLKRIVHQEELNVFLRDSKDKVGVDFLKACLEFPVLLIGIQRGANPCRFISKSFTIYFTLPL